ncbi:FAD-dependent monooxygenase [Longimicrobium sp.]|uniref:FAD-dependent monooxygenase n=1 Tax=Longimicrobium sp. TaxID=2029185 RepID=UPI002E37DB2E|nr:FAD-dependent monooxygenase [Longimicrobium sp.]HEX6042706.1 FAD-dependent monooxygenase [Longimicrobium sp.]
MLDAGAPAIVVGGGIGGLSAAIALRRAGIQAEVHERAPELREVGAGISLWPNATRQLRAWGLLDEVLRRGFRLAAGDLRDPRGRVLTRMSLPPADAPSVLIHRADLHAVLADALPPWAVRTGAEFRALRETAEGVEADFGDGGTETGRFLVGADGLWSAVRRQLLDDGEPVYRGYPVWRGVAPAGSAEWPGLTETLGRGLRFGIVPIGGGRVAWWATANEPEHADDGTEGRKARLLRLFGDWHDPIPQLIQATPDGEILKNGTYDRPPVRRWGRGRVTLLGDAAHPTTPNFGQGGCMAIEDAAVLARCLARTDDVPAALRAFEAQRYRRTAWITRESLRYGRVAQWQRAGAVRLRETLFRLTPPSLTSATLARMFAFEA